MSVGALRSVGYSFAISCGLLAALPASAITYFVSNTNDSGLGSLRQAMTDANANPGPHTIFVQLPANSTIVPGSPLPPVTQTMTIDGSPTSNLTIAGSNAVRGFFVASNQLFLINMRLQQMRARGGNGGSSAGSGAGGGGLGAGGAVFVNYAAFLSLTNVSIENSQAIGGSGGVSFTVPPSSASGAAGGGGMLGQGGNGSAQGGGGGGGGLFGNGGEGGASTSPGGNGFGFGAGTGASSPVANQAGGGGGGGPTGGGGGASVSQALAGTAGIGGLGILIANTDSGLGGLGSFGGNGFGGSFGSGGNGGKGTASGANFSFGGGGGGGPGGGGGGGSAGGQGGGGGDFAGAGGSGAEPAGQTVDPATGIGAEGGYGGGGAGGRHLALVGGAPSAGGLGGFGAGNGGASTLNGNGGSGLGGAIFVREGGSVNIVTSFVTGSTVTAGTGPTPGQARGTGFYVDGNGSPVTFLGSGTSTINDSFSGTGGINKLQVGTLILNSCQSDYTGPTIINGGVVEIACTEAIGDPAAPIILGNGTLKTNASFTLNHPLNFQILTGPTNSIIDNGPYEITVTQPVVGVGPADFTKLGSGKLAMVAGGSWNGTTTIVGGTLETSGVFFNFPVLVQPGATLSVQATPATVPQITALGTVSIGSSLTIQGGAPSVLSATNGIGTLTIAPASTVTVAGPLTHAGFTYIDGALVMGPGSLLLSNYSVNPGGTLSGVGNTASGNVAGGTISPGINGIGTLITGSLNIAPTSTLRIEVDGLSADRLQLQGPTTLNGTLDVVALSPAPIGTTYTIVIGAQLAGTFNGLADGALITVPGGKFRIHYDYFANSVTLTSVDVPGVPTNVMATPGPGSATITFDAPVFTGGTPILGYTVRCTFTTFGVVEVTGAASPITLTGLTGGTVYTCTVATTNAAGNGAPSAQVVVTPTVATSNLLVIRYGNGTGTVTSNIAGINCGPDCTEDYANGTAVVLTATPAVNSVFRGWTAGCAGTGACNITMNAPITVLALFMPDPAAFPLADFDDDGIPNGVEITLGRDPYVKDNDVFANTRLFAMQQYRDFLGREGDAVGIQFYVDLLDAGTLIRANVIENFFNSPEFSGIASPIARLYFATFLRTPDYPGLIFQIDAFRSGTPLPVIANNFTASPEFQATYGALNNAQFVALLYTNILGRSAAQVEIDYHVARLVAGATRGEVLVGFSESPEYQTAIANEVYVTMMYVGMLRRAPEPAGLTYWVNYMDAGNPGLALILGFLNAPEYRNRFLP